MRAVWLEANKLRFVGDAPTPTPPRGEALVRVTLAGICNTDLELTRGYYPYAGIPGHEFVGVVEEAPGAEGWIGKRVVGEINATCGACANCTSGRPNHCDKRTVLGIEGRPGVFAEYALLPAANLHEVPADLPDDLAVFAEPTAAAIRVQRQVRIRRNDRVLVIGDGKLGNLAAQTLALTSCDLVVLGRHRRKLDLLESRGIRTVVDEDGLPWPADVVVECTGKREGLAIARSAVRPEGTIVVKSTYAGETRINLSAVVVDEVRIMGSRCGPFGPALDVLAKGSIHVRPLIDARFPLEEAEAAFERAAVRGTLKVLLEC